MATGDQKDMLARLQNAIPAQWFPDSSPVRDAILNGFAYALAQIYALIAYAKNQMRVATATDGFLDLVSFDYFGLNLLRRPTESDPNFRTRIFQNLIRQKATRNGLIKALLDLTGYTPIVFEPWRPADTGAYNVGTMAYGVAGGYGSLALPYQGFVTAFRPLNQGIANIPGYGDPQGGYGVPTVEYANPSLIVGAVTDDDIYAAIADNKPEGTIVWTRITNPT